MDLPNIFVIVTDSARAFDSGSGDDRERPHFYDSLTDFTFCPYAYCSAPSSVMSGAALLASTDAYMISRNYDDFRFGSGIGASNLEALRDLGYVTNGFFVARELREKLGPLTGISGMGQQKSLKYSDRMWSNASLNEVVDNFLILNKDIEVPQFNLIWNNIRNDTNINKNLYDLVDIIKKHDLWEDSLIFFLSDHGYPTADKGITPEGLKRDKKTHDLWMTEDNIRIPFYFKSSFDNHGLIPERVSTLDIFPTILSVLGQNSESFECKGISLSTLNRNRSKQLRNRFIRVDSRFIGQSDRKTALINKDIKMVKDYDNGSNTFYHIDKEYGEKEIHLPKASQEKFFNELTKREGEAFRFQYLQKIKRINSDRIEKIVLFSGDDELIRSLMDYFHIDRDQIQSELNGLSDLFNRGTLIMNHPSFLLRMLSNILPFAELMVPDADEQVVLKWTISRYVRAVILALPYAKREPKYIWIRIKELVR